MTKRRAQIVRDRVSEGLQLLVRSFELGGPLDDPMFEFVVEIADFLLVRFSLLGLTR
jgi:hypothetical protein